MILLFAQDIFKRLNKITALHTRTDLLENGTA